MAYVVVYWNRIGIYGEMDLIEPIVYDNREDAVKRLNELQSGFVRKLEIAEISKD